MLFARSKSIRLRVAGLFVAIFGAILIAFSIILYKVQMRTEQGNFDMALYNHAVDVAQGIDFNLFGDLRINKDLGAAEGKVFPFSVGKSFLQVISPSGQVIARSRTLERATLPVFVDDLSALERDRVIFRTIPRSEIPSSAASAPFYRLLTYLVPRGLGESYILQVAAPMTLVSQSGSGFITFFLIAIPLALVISLFGGLYLSREAFEPISAIIEKAKSLNPANLTERIPVPAADDELRQLSLTLNDLLERLWRAFDSQERFIANASHELKTPLTIIRGELDLLEKKGIRAEPEVAAFLASASQELNHLSGMVEELLLLARVDAGAASLSLKRVFLEELVLDVVSRLGTLSRRKDLKIRFNVPENEEENSRLEVNADPELLAVAIKNLLENAIKYSPEGGTIEVALAVQGRMAEVLVRDHGPGIPREELGKVFDRFYRVPSADQARIPGVGLGLAIAYQVAKVHQGELTVEAPEEGGAVFQLKLPTTSLA